MMGRTGAAIALTVVLAMLAACSGGGGGGSGGSMNRAPTITGTPPTSVLAGQGYSFQPMASDPDGQALTFSITGKPAWATFDATTGRLAGTPAATDAGMTPSITISVSDGQATASLPPFTISVLAASSGSAELLWTAPTLNEDGSALTSLAGYKVRYGRSPDALTLVLDVAGPANTRVTIEGLATGSWYFTVASYTNAGVESAPTGAVSKTI